jgi:hypothetical protein
MRYRLLILTALLAAAGCGSPNAPSELPQISGDWAGTLQSTNWPTAPVAVTMTQSGASISGSWTSPTFDWSGTITGTVTKSAFNGTFTVTAPTESGQGRCTGNAVVSGPATGASSMVWTSTGITSECTNAPFGLTFSLQR